MSIGNLDTDREEFDVSGAGRRIVQKNDIYIFNYTHTVWTVSPRRFIDSQSLDKLNFVNRNAIITQTNPYRYGLVNVLTTPQTNTPFAVRVEKSSIQ